MILPVCRTSTPAVAVQLIMIANHQGLLNQTFNLFGLLLMIFETVKKFETLYHCAVAEIIKSRARIDNQKYGCR
jgi:hypothetical protein